MVLRTSPKGRTTESSEGRAISPPLAWGLGVLALALAAALFVNKGALGGSDAYTGTSDAAERATPSNERILLERAEAAPATARVLATQRQSYAVFRGPPETPPAAVPARVAEVLAVPLSSLDANAAQLLRTDLGNLWIVNSRQGLTCIVEAGRLGSTCSATVDFVKRGLALGTFAAPPSEQVMPESFLLLGVAPDWARAVQLRIDSRSETRAVVGNAYARRAPVPVMVAGLEGHPPRRGGEG